MDMSEVLDKYGLTLATVLSEDSLKTLVTVHSALVETLSAETETQQNREKEIRDSIKLTHQVSETEGSNMSEIRKILASMMEHDPNISVCLVDAVQDIKQDVMTFRDFHIASIARESKPEKVKDSAAVEERKDEANALRDCIVSVYNLMGKPKGVIPTKKNKAGEDVVELPRIPGGNTSGNVGRGAKVRQLRMSVDDHIFEPGTVLYDVLQRFVNDFASGNVIKVTEFWEIVEKEVGTESGAKYPEGYENRWTVKVFGKTVSGWLDK